MLGKQTPAPQAGGNRAEGTCFSKHVFLTRALRKNQAASAREDPRRLRDLEFSCPERDNWQPIGLLIALVVLRLADAFFAGREAPSCERPPC
jgi:hypothetical protein